MYVSFSHVMRRSIISTMKPQTHFSSSFVFNIFPDIENNITYMKIILIFKPDILHLLGVALPLLQIGLQYYRWGFSTTVASVTDGASVLQ